MAFGIRIRGCGFVKIGLSGGLFRSGLMVELIGFAACPGRRTCGTDEVTRWETPVR